MKNLKMIIKAPLKIMAFYLLFSAVACGQAPATLIKTEHGWRGKYLEATRMKTRDGMHNIKFEEIKFTGMIDRAEVDSIIQICGGNVLSGDFGGLDMVIFKGMDTKEKTDSTIRVVLPKLERWYSKQ